MGVFTLTDTEEGISLVLNPVMDLAVAETLRSTLLDCLVKEKNIHIDAGDVDRITTPCLQLLLAMKNRVSPQNIDFKITKMSEAFHITLDDVGLADQFMIPEQKV